MLMVPCLLVISTHFSVQLSPYGVGLRLWFKATMDSVWTGSTKGASSPPGPCLGAIEHCSPKLLLGVPTCSSSYHHVSTFRFDYLFQPAYVLYVEKCDNFSMGIKR